MTRFIIRRLLQAIPTFLGITMLSYLIMVLAPGDPASLLSFGPDTTPEQKEALSARLGVNDPLPLQYFRWLVGDDWREVAQVTWHQFALEDGALVWLSERQVNIDATTGAIQLLATRQPYRLEPRERAEVAGDVGRRDPLELVSTTVESVHGDQRGILRGDFGNSFRYRENPLKLILERLPASIELNVAVLAVGMTLGILIGVLSAVWRGKPFDTGARVLAVVGDAVPVFWLAYLLLLFFSAPFLDILPMGGRCGHHREGCPPVYARLEYLILPTATYAVGAIGGWSRYMRAAMLENISSDYIRTARAKGLSPRTVWFRHALRNAMIPMATFLGPTLVGLLSGAVVVEQIFAWPGIGRLTLQAVTGQDYPMIMTSVVIGAVLTIIAYLISDILYAVFDPRIRLG